MKPNPTRRLLAAGAALAAGLIAITAMYFRSADPRRDPSGAKSVAVAKETAVAVSQPLFPDQFLLRPLPVSLSKDHHEWTSEDAKDLKVIERISHNPEESIRLIEENDRIKRRQLVYRKETVPMLLERIQGAGGSLKSFTLPGLDGREVEVEVTEVRLMDGIRGGCVNGRVKGRFNSMVSVGFSNGCESFNVLSPDEGLFLTADAREPGEVLVKEIDPNIYGRPPETNTPCVVDVGNSGPSPSK